MNTARNWRAIAFAGTLLGTSLVCLGVLRAAPPAPPPFDRLLDQARAELVFYDPAEVKRKFPGQTTFTLFTMFRFDVNYDSRRRGRVYRVNARVKVDSVKSTLDHKLEFPRYYDQEGLWQTPLARHELDHLLLSADPRARLLNRAALESLTTFQFELPDSEKVTDQLVRERISAQCESRRQSVVDFMQALQQRLDRVSRHGNLSIEDRQQFFAEAYGKQLLAELKFPWLDDVLPVVQSRVYDKAGREFVELYVPVP